MTVNEIITSADSLKPNSYRRDDKLKWLENAERRIYNEIYLTHEHKDISFTDFEQFSDGTQELFAPAPYDELYVLYIAAMIDFANAEYGRYNNTIQLFNELYESFQKYWHNLHMPVMQSLIKC